jgi:hypothetical protein
VTKRTIVPETDNKMKMGLRIKMYLMPSQVQAAQLIRQFIKQVIISINFVNAWLSDNMGDALIQSSFTFFFGRLVD